LKEKVPRLKPFLEEMVLGGGQSGWQRLFYKLGGYFDERFDPDWKEKDQFLKEFIKELRPDQ